MFDVTNTKSFFEVHRMKNYIDEHVSGNAIITLVGAKIDMYQDRVVSWEEGWRKVLTKLLRVDGLGAL